MKFFECYKCGSKEVFIKRSGTNNGLYCADCGAWIKWITNNEFVLAKRQIEEMKFNTALTNKEREMSSKPLVNTIFAPPEPTEPLEFEDVKKEIHEIVNKLNNNGLYNEEQLNEVTKNILTLIIKQGGKI